jgi:hypothetical protein
VASELAFHRWRVARGLTRGAYADMVREAEYTQRISDLCRAVLREPADPAETRPPPPAEIS